MATSVSSVPPSNSKPADPHVGGFAGWLLRTLRGTVHPHKRLVLLERIPLGARQSLALVEADGRQVLVAMSADGSPAFLPLSNSERMPARTTGRQGRVSW